MISLPLQLTHRWKSVIWLQTICLFWSLFCLFFNLVFSGVLYYNENQKETIASKYYYNFLPENQIIFHELGNSGRDVLILL